MLSPPPEAEARATRRRFLRGMAGAMAAAIVGPGRLLAGAREERLLSFVHTHTHERLSLPYFADGAYLPEGLASLNTFLKDHRTGEAHPIDPALYDILNDLRLATGTSSPFQVISAYRSPRTNAMLREHGGGVAKGSLHLSGRAIDVRSPTFRPRRCGTRRSSCSDAASATTAAPTSSTWTQEG